MLFSFTSYLQLRLNTALYAFPDPLAEPENTGVLVFMKV